MVQIHIQTKLSFLSVYFPSDSLQKFKWDHLWTERWLLCSWFWSEGIVQSFGLGCIINSRPSSNLVIHQSSNSLMSLGFLILHMVRRDSLWSSLAVFLPTGKFWQEQQFASGGPELCQKLLQCFLFTEVRQAQFKRNLW